MPDDGYVLEINCYNCKESLSLTIKNGQSLLDHLKYNGEKCSNCKCYLIPNRYG